MPFFRRSDGDDFDIQRENMVKYQLKARGIKDERVLEAMRRIPRHIFVPERYKGSAYEDRALPTIKGQTISQPYMVALMTEALELKDTDRVLEIGTGTGYQTAIIASIAKEVYSIERIEELTDLARMNLNMLGITNVYLFTGDGSLGLEEHAPFDKIIIEAATPDIPEPLIEQLKLGGILVAPVGNRYHQRLVVLRKKRYGIEEETKTSCVFVPLLGKYGFKE